MIIIIIIIIIIIYTFFRTQTQLSMKFQLLIKLKSRQIIKFLALNLSDDVFTMLINVKTPPIGKDTFRAQLT